MAWSDFEACPPASVKAPVPVTTLEEPLPPGPYPPPGGGGGLPDGGVLALPFAAWELPDGAVATRVVLDGFATVVAVASRDIEIFGMAAFVAPLAPQADRTKAVTGIASRERRNLDLNSRFDIGFQSELGTRLAWVGPNSVRTSGLPPL